MLFGTYFIPLSITQTVNYNIHKCSEIFDEGQVLFAPMWGTTTYLIDSDGTVNHTWSSSYLPGISVWWMGDGTILRSIKVAGGPIEGGAGGGVQPAADEQVAPAPHPDRHRETVRRGRVG